MRCFFAALTLIDLLTMALNTSLLNYPSSKASGLPFWGSIPLADKMRLSQPSRWAYSVWTRFTHSRTSLKITFDGFKPVVRCFSSQSWGLKCLDVTRSRKTNVKMLRIFGVPEKKKLYWATFQKISESISKEILSLIRLGVDRTDWKSPSLSCGFLCPKTYNTLKL